MSNGYVMWVDDNSCKQYDHGWKLSSRWIFQAPNLLTKNINTKIPSLQIYLNSIGTLLQITLASKSTVSAKKMELTIVIALLNGKILLNVKDL